MSSTTLVKSPSSKLATYSPLSSIFRFLTYYFGKRRAQYIAVLTIFSVPVLCIIALLLIWRSTYTKKYTGTTIPRYILIGYLLWIYLIDYNTPKRGGRPNQDLRTW